MRIYFLLIGLLCAVMAKGQQNLFNIPSGDITPKGKLFYQHQLNFYGWDDLETKSHVVYGFGKGWDAGLNFVDLPLRLNTRSVVAFNDDSNRKPLYPLLMATVQKGWTTNKQWNFNTGFQAGPNLSYDFSKKKLAYFVYGLVRWRPSEFGYVTGGPYVTNHVFVGGGKDQHVGFHGGYEYKLNKRWLLMGDFISGNHKKSQTVIGGGYTVNKRVQLFLGGLLAFPNRKLTDGVVFELNWYGWDITDH